jgi:hypothetical protein
MNRAPTTIAMVSGEGQLGLNDPEMQNTHVAALHRRPLLLAKTRKLADDRSNFCSQIGNTALVTCTDRPPTAAGRILRYLIHSHIITNRQELGLRELA